MPTKCADMTVQLVAEPSYEGANGLSLLRQVQQDLFDALAAENWQRVRELDRTCAALVERVIAANRAEPSMLVGALRELKGVYASLIQQCQLEVSALAL